MALTEFRDDCIYISFALDDLYAIRDEIIGKTYSGALMDMRTIVNKGIRSLEERQKEGE